MSASSLRANLLLALAATAACFLAVEAAYRVLDPFPYVPKWEVNRERGHLTRYDPELGWSGAPGVREELVTENGRFRVENNSQGFRDVEHRQAPPYKDAVVFLGDSFTWGYEAATDAMFVSRVRRPLAAYEVFNLAHRGYGTDQSLLALRRWRFEGRLRLVVLMFCENDLSDNAARFRYGAYKPMAEVEGAALVFTNVPVPRSDKWDERGPPEAPGLLDRLRALGLSSHFLHDVAFRLDHPRTRPAPDPERHVDLLPLTGRIVGKLRDEVAARGGELLLVAIPAKRQLLREPGFVPYQLRIESLCAELGVAYLDLAPALQASVGRTYYRIGEHWNEHGHEVVAAALLEHLAARTRLQVGSGG